MPSPESDPWLHNSRKIASLTRRGRYGNLYVSLVCESAGFETVRTYIASGNVVFKSRKSGA